MGFELKLFFSATLVALGIVLPVEAFAAGLLLAMGLAYGVMTVSEPEDRPTVLTTLYLALVMAILAAIIHPHVSYISWLPVQATMAIAGALSRPIAAAVMPFGAGLKKWAEKLPEMIKFPGSK